MVIAAAAAAWGLKALHESGRIANLFHRAEPPGADEVPELNLASMEPQVAKALTAAREGILADIENDESWGKLGVVLDAHEMYDPAIACYRVAHRIDPREFRWAYFLGRTLKFQGEESPEIVELLESATKIRPDYAPAEVRLGDALSRQGRKEDARDAYQRAIELDGQSWMAYRGLGQTLLDLGDAKGAVAALERATALESRDGAGHASLARAYLLAGDKSKAEEAANRSRGLEQLHTMTDPVLEEVGVAGVSSSICLRRANELIERGRYQEALQNLAVVLEVLPDNPNVHLRIAGCHKGLHQADQAIMSFERALAIEDSIPGAHGQLGMLLAAEGKFVEAAGHYRRAITLGIPDSAATRALLAAALAQAGQEEDALREFDRAARAGPLNAVAHNNWGSLLARRSQPRQALVHFEEAARLDPGSASAHFNWGLALEGSGDLPGALREFGIAARIDPRGPASRRIRELTANSQK